MAKKRKCGVQIILSQREKEKDKEKEKENNKREKLSRWGSVLINATRGGLVVRWWGSIWGGVHQG